MKIYDVSRLPSSITLGWDGENNWRPIAFDCSALLNGRSDAVATLWLLPKGESQAFPVALDRDGNTVVWTPLNEEMTAERGQLQIVVQDGTDVGKSKVIDYTVRDSLVGGADHPAEAPSWAVQVVADVTEQADRAEEAASSIDPESIEQTVAEAVEGYMDKHPVQAPVTSVNGKTGAVTLSASDVGALPDSTVIPTVPQMATDLGMTDWTTGKTVDAAVLALDFSTALAMLNELGDRLNALADSDDTTLDQLSEIVAYIKNNKSLIDSITTSKVSVSDIVDSLVSADATKPLSANQGRVLKALIDAIVVPTAVSQLTNDASYQTASDVQTAIEPLQPKAITDTGGYFTTDTVEGALQEIGAELAGINTLIGSGVIS